MIISEERLYISRRMPSDERTSKEADLAYAHRMGNRVIEDSEKITLRLPKRFLRALDFLVEMDDFPSRSEAVRAAIRDLVYARVELVGDRLKKLEEAEKALANLEAIKRQYMSS